MVKGESEQEDFNESLKIRKLPSSRWGEYRELRLEAMKSDPLAFGSSYDEEARHGIDVWEKRIENTLFALYNSKAIGMVSYVFRSRTKEKHIAEIHSVYVRKEYRCRGIGDKLLKKALSLIGENKIITKVTLTVTTEEKHAVSLYKRNGFKVVGELKGELRVDDKFYDELIMEIFI